MSTKLSGGTHREADKNRRPWEGITPPQVCHPGVAEIARKRAFRHCFYDAR